MKEKMTILKLEIEKHFHSTGEITEWSRSINPPGEYLHINKNGFRLFILDSAVEDNQIKEIFERITKFSEHIEEFKGHWTLDSKLNIKPDRS